MSGFFLYLQLTKKNVMKKIILLLLLVSGFVNAQKIGKTELKVEGVLGQVERENSYNSWLETPGGYMMEFKVNTIGVKNAVEIVKEILSKNNISFVKPQLNKSFLASYVNNIDDYENLNMSISAGGSEVYMMWLFDEKTICLSLKEGMYLIIINK